VRRSINTSFDSSGAELICTPFILTFCDRGAIGLLPPFDLYCGKYQALAMLARKRADVSGSRAASTSCLCPPERPRRIASRRGRSSQRSRYLSRASPRRFRSALIAALPTLCRCLLTRHGRRPSALQLRSVLVGHPGFLHSRMGRISDRRDGYGKNGTRYHDFTFHLQSPDRLTATTRPSGIVRGQLHLRVSLGSHRWIALMQRHTGGGRNGGSPVRDRKASLAGRGSLRDKIGAAGTSEGPSAKKSVQLPRQPPSDQQPCVALPAVSHGDWQQLQWWQGG
jgi:hypothetical protein